MPATVQVSGLECESFPGGIFAMLVSGLDCESFGGRFAMFASNLECASFPGRNIRNDCQRFKVRIFPGGRFAMLVRGLEFRRFPTNIVKIMQICFVIYT